MSERFTYPNDRGSASYSFAALVTRSEQVAAQGVGRGDSVVVMLGNQVELWESMLALIRLGAVIMPTTTAAGPVELVDRFDRGGARAVVCNAADTAKFDDVPGDYVRVAVGAATDDWCSYASAYDRVPMPLPHPGNASTDRLLLYLTSGTTARPQAGGAHSSVLSRGPPVHYVLAWPPTGDLHLNISSPGWAKHVWSNFFAP